MKIKNKKLKVYYVIFSLLLIIAIITLVFIGIKYGGNQINEKESKEVVAQVREEEQQGKAEPIQFYGMPVIGIIRIPKIELEYPILEETTKQTMKKAITRFSGGAVNEYGNLALAGHNNKDGTMFGKTKKLEVGDQIELTDLKKQTISYKITEIFVTDPNDVTILATKDEAIREVTLITCTNGNKERLIIKAQEI